MPRAKKTVDTAKIEHLLTRNVEDVIDRAHLKSALESGKKLRVKLGIDPTSPDLHLGHAVVLSKLREFQALGHRAVLIIGDFTARIGDPSGRSTERKPLSEKEVNSNLKKYLEQAGKVIDTNKLEVRYNSEWFLTEGLQHMIALAGASSIQQVLRRADFRKRIDENNDITLSELFYPVMQGYDSVKVKADVELGGTDQTFNLLMGRRVQRHFGLPEQDILTVPLLEGLDGEKKMSKSVGNYIGLTEKAENMFGKTMSIPDALITRWFTLATDIPKGEVAAIESDLRNGTNPKTIKERLAFEIVKRYHGEVAARKAREKFSALFVKKEKTMTLPALKVKPGATIAEAVLVSKVVKSKSEAWRLIEQGAVSVNDEVKKDPRETLTKIKTGDVVKIGKRRFFRIKV